MLHRSGPRRGALRALLPTAALLALAAPAHAASQDDRSFPVPADAPTVATTPSGAAVLAWVHGGSTCTALQPAGTPRPTRAGQDHGAPGREEQAAGSCDGTPVPSRLGAGELGAQALGGEPGTEEVGDDRVVQWGYTGLDVAKVQLKREGAVLAESATSAPGVLPAPATDLRFWAVELPVKGAQADELARLDATGVVRRAAAPSTFGPFLDDTGDDELSTAGGTRLQHGRTTAGGTWALWSVADTELDPTPLQPERTVTERCLVFVVDNGNHGFGGRTTGPCDGPLMSESPMLALPGTDCTVGAHVDVVVSAAVRRAVVVLGDGTRRAVPLRAFGADTRAGTVIVGDGMAVRRVDALGSGGRTLSTQPLFRLAPTRAASASLCSGVWGAYTSDTPGPSRLDGAGPHVLHAVDHGVELCLSVDAAPRVPGDCVLPPTEPSQTSVRVTPTSDGRFVYGVVPAEVVAARITLDDGSTRTVAATPLNGYAGIYAGVLGQVAVDLPGPHAVTRVELLDDRGRVLQRSAATHDPTTLRKAVTVLGAAHGVPAARAAPWISARTPATCVAFGPITELSDCVDDLTVDSGGADTVTVSAECAPRRLVVFAILRHRADRLLVRTSRGRLVRARTAAFPAAAGPAAAGKAFAVAVLGPRDGLAEALVRGRAANRVAVDLPPAARQCGYADTPGVADLFGDLD